jgi:serine/threonine protein kinase
MHDIETVMRNLIEISELKLPGGWQAWIAVRDGGKERFSKSEWEKLLAEPGKLLEGVQQTIKSDGENIVAIKYLAIGGRGIKVVMKRHRRGGGVRESFRAMGPPRGLRNFIGAVKIRQYGMPVAAPLAGLYRRRFLFCDESIYISEYVEGVNLDEFLKNPPKEMSERNWVIGQLGRQMAAILVTLNGNGLWHRDAKATNFVVCRDEDGEYRLVITDMDGIRPGRGEDKQMSALWRLAASVMGIAGIRRTDYMRMFKTYCETAGIPPEREGEIFHELSRRAQTKYRSQSK